MSASLVTWRRTAVAAFAIASLSGVSLDAANAQDASEEMQRAKAALSAALRDRVAAEQKRAETPAPAPQPAAAPAPAQGAPTPATVAEAEADPAPAAPRRETPDAAGTAAADFPATTGSLPAQPAGSLAATPAAPLALPASLAPTVPSLASNDLSVYRE